MTISIHRLSYLFLSALAEAKPVWARMVGIGGTQLWLGEPGDYAASMRSIALLRRQVQGSRGGDAVERSLLLGLIDEELAGVELGCALRDPAAWIESIVLGLELLEDEPPSQAAAFLKDVPAFLAASIDAAGTLDRRVVAWAGLRAGDASAWFRQMGLEDTAGAIDRAVPAWREQTGEVPVMARAAHERLFRAVHRLGFPADELHASALTVIDKIRSRKIRGRKHADVPDPDDLARAVDESRARWCADGDAVSPAVRAALRKRPAWLSPYRPMRPLEPDRAAVLHPCADTAASIALRYAYPGEHALRAGALRHRSDLRRVVAAPATIAGWRAFVAHLAAGVDPPVEDAARAAADGGIHAGLWEPDEAAHRIAEASSLSVARAQSIVAEVLARPVYASAAFVGYQEFLALWESCDVPPERFVAAALACGPVPIPIAAQIITKVLAAG